MELLCLSQKAMKLVQRTGFLMFVLSFYLSGNGQSLEDPRYFETKIKIPAYLCDIYGKKLEESWFMPSARSRFVFIRYVGDTGAVIQFVRWSLSRKQMRERSDDSLPKVGPKVIGDQYYLINKADLENNCNDIYRKGGIKFTVGVVTLPVKIRPGKDFDFGGTISLGATGGARVRISKHKQNYINLLFAATTSTVDIDKTSSNAANIEPVKNVAVFSPGVGLVAQFDKSQVGIFVGRDYLSKSNSLLYQWKYQRKLWISFGFGISIVTIADQMAAAAGK